MVCMRSLVVALAAIAVAACASAPGAAATGAVCVTTTTKCCYSPYLCGVIVKSHPKRVAYSCNEKVAQKVEVPCHGYTTYTHRTYTAKVYKCYATKYVLVHKTCYKNQDFKKYFAKVCYRESCSTSVSGTKPTDGTVGDGVDEHTTGSDPTAYFKHLYGY